MYKISHLQEALTNRKQAINLCMNLNGYQKNFLDLLLQKQELINARNQATPEKPFDTSKLKDLNNLLIDTWHAQKEYLKIPSPLFKVIMEKITKQ